MAEWSPRHVGADWVQACIVTDQHTSRRDREPGMLVERVRDRRFPARLPPGVIVGEEDVRRWSLAFAPADADVLAAVRPGDLDAAGHVAVPRRRAERVDVAAEPQFTCHEQLVNSPS